MVDDKVVFKIKGCAASAVEHSLPEKLVSYISSVYGTPAGQEASMTDSLMMLNFSEDQSRHFANGHNETQPSNFTNKADVAHKPKQRPMSSQIYTSKERNAVKSAVMRSVRNLNELRQQPQRRLIPQP